MASESYFKNTFCAEIIKAYGPDRLPTSRVQAIWNSVKNFQDDALATALKEVVKPERFPGADKIIEACAVANGNLKSRMINQAKVASECLYCAEGIRQANGYAYRCSCKLGELNYPNFPPYNGQAPFQEKRWEEKDEAGEVYEFFEDAKAIHIKKKGSKEIKDHKFILKIQAAPAQNHYSDKTKLIKANRYEVGGF
jgi:hypothetical protein